MRNRWAFTLTAGQRWPDGFVGNGQITIPRFNWLLVDNKGSNPVDVALHAQPTAGDKADTLFTVGAGKVRVKNVAGPTDGGPDDPADSWAETLSLVSASGTSVVVEIADHPIVDISSAT